MISTRPRTRLAARRLVAAAGIGAALAFAGQAPAFAGPGDFPVPDIDLVIPTLPPVPPIDPVPPFEVPDLPEAVPTDDPTEPGDVPDGPGDLVSCDDPGAEDWEVGDLCDHGDEPTEEPTPEPVDPCEPTEPGREVIDDFTAVIPMTDGGEFHITAEVAECTPTTGGGGGAPFTG